MARGSGLKRVGQRFEPECEVINIKGADSPVMQVQMPRHEDQRKREMVSHIVLDN